MLTLPSAPAKKILAWGKKNVPDESLAEDGREDYIHCTVLWGFGEETTKSDIVPEIPDHPIEITLGKLKRFKADDSRPDSDVLYVEVLSADLKAWNADLREKFDVVVKNPDYTPHVTIAYVKPGELSELDGTEITDDEAIECTSLVFATALGKKKDVLEITDRVLECYHTPPVVISFEEFLHRNAA